MTDRDATPRSWVIEIPGRPPTANKQRRGDGAHWSKRAASTVVWRQAARDLQWSARNAGNAPGSVHAVTVEVCQVSKDRRWLQDLGGCFPAAKAAIDGLVDAGLIPDDKPDHLRALTFTPPDVCGRDALRLTITELTTRPRSTT